MRRSERFWKKVSVVGPHSCWLWNAAMHGAGYGAFWNGERLVQAHRWAYEELVGPIPAGLTLDHLCRVKTCVNPAHLEPVSHRENNLRGESMAAVHARKTECIHGHEFTPENTRISPRGTRICRACHRVSVGAAKRARRAA